MLTAVDVFDTDEMLYLNKASEGILLKDLTRERILQFLGLAANVINENDFLLCGFVDRLTEKFTGLTDDEWKRFATELPFELAYEGGSTTNA